MELIAGGALYMKSWPQCPVHGQMRLDKAAPPPQVLWTCAGWDGEGCDHQVDAADIPWVHIGEAENVTLQWRSGS